MGFSSKGGGDFHQGVVDHFFGEVHGDLPCEDDFLMARFFFDFGSLDFESGGDAFQDFFDGDLLAGSFGLKHFGEDFFYNILGQMGGSEPRVGREAIDGPFNLSDVIVNVFCDEEGDLVGNIETARFRLVFDNGHPCLQIGCSHVRNETPFHAGDHSLRKL